MCRRVVTEYQTSRRKQSKLTMTHSSDSIGARSRRLLRALDITVEADGQLSGDIAGAREAVEDLLSDTDGASSARLRAALGAGSLSSLNRGHLDALAVLYNRLLA